MSARAGFIGTRFAGTDGVSLETGKWATVLARLGIESVYFAGESDRDKTVSYVVPHAFFEAPRVAAIQRAVFGTRRRRRETTNEIHDLVRELKEHLYRFLDAWQPDLLIPQNALAIPMHIPLGIALTEVIAETGIPVIAHHHDFFWERDRFRIHSVEDYLSAAFPPCLASIEHVVINREAQRQIALRRGLSARVIPNVFDFSPPPPEMDEYNFDLRGELGIAPEEILLLQPSRIIARKGIEHSVELAARLHIPERSVILVIPHHELDEGDQYAARVVDYARRLGIRTLIQSPRIALQRGINKAGEKIYSLWDLYLHADFITYPSLYEGFGNAFVEAVFFRKPILVNRYPVYREDLEPLGFQVVTMDSYVTQEVVRETEEVLQDPREQERRAVVNADIAARYFSYDVLQRHLADLTSRLWEQER